LSQKNGRKTGAVLVYLLTLLYRDQRQTRARADVITEGEEGVFRVEQNEDSLNEALAGDIVLYVVGMVLDTECQQLHND